MTVITKPLTSEKKPADKAPLVVPVCAEGNADLEQGLASATGKGSQTDPTFNERYHHIWKRTNNNARVSSATTLCLLITALLVVSVGLFGGVYVYKQMTRMQRFRGWCNVPYAGTSAYHSSRIGMPRNEELTDPMLGVSSIDSTNGMSKIDDDGISNWYESDSESDSQGAASFFREEFEIDLGNEKYSKVQVPDFKYGRLGRFIHEFDSNKTAIVDQTAKRCFIMPLDRERVLPPKSMYDMIEKMWKGYYSVNTHRVRETMRVVLPPLDDLSDVGEYIRQECEDKTTYRLEKSTDRIFKRSAESKSLPFTEFTGLATMEYDIVNMNQIQKLEAEKNK